MDTLCIERISQKIKKKFLKIEGNEAEWAVYNLGCSYHNQTKLTLCSQPTAYLPSYWWTKYPKETSKFWNLLKLLSPEAWMWTFLTFILITVTLRFASCIGNYIGINVGSEEVALIPFRWASMT